MTLSGGLDSTRRPSSSASVGNTTFRVRVYDLTAASTWKGLEVSADARIICTWICPPSEIPDRVSEVIGNFYAFVEDQ